MVGPTHTVGLCSAMLLCLASADMAIIGPTYAGWWAVLGVGGVAAASAVSQHQWASGAMVAWGGSRGVDGGVGVDSPHYA